MKKCIISAILGAIGMLLLLLMSNNDIPISPQPPKEYVHMDYISNITNENCFMCSDIAQSIASLHWSEDNIGIVDLNSFELLYLEINRYNDCGELINEPAGYMESCSLVNGDKKTYVHTTVFPDNAYAQVQITGVKCVIDRDFIQNKLCQSCLDAINDLWYNGRPPVEYAVISFAERTIRPLISSYPWFSAGNFGLDCAFNEDGTIDILVHYCPNRYESEIEKQ